VVDEVEEEVEVEAVGLEEEEVEVEVEAVGLVGDEVLVEAVVEVEEVSYKKLCYIHIFLGFFTIISTVSDFEKYLTVFLFLTPQEALLKKEFKNTKAPK
jgi:hypothetical protein